ncbi:hypothetical protein [Enterococcus rivorum]|uniref:Uncharacterized protein n=1 Tax=Enterococcus rivorum TaxID=762845 RepID=A0A1E5KUS2_9ENTE|nr:hypothetical protein [Enterococcus rivorum]MBP2100452.1 hypothetical protein [Enterococcus rivorum]OEH81613.1 hypothetical protein BCR26_16195 [Enterococcus rivorum]
MFEIKFKIFENDESDNFIGEYGYFSFVIDDESYGIILEEEIDDFSVSIYDWFTSFLKSLEILKKENYVLINDIESFNTWIELCRDKEIVSISKVSGDKVGQGGLVRKEKLSDADYKFWKDKKAVFSDFRIEILEKSEKYLTDLVKLNSSKNSNVLELSDLITKLKSF